MREAVGGSLLLYIIIPIIILIIIFIGFIMNYASTYRAANYVTTQIESCNADMNKCQHSSIDKIKQEINDKYGYNGNFDVCCIDNDKGSVYRTSLNVEFELPLIGEFSPFNVKTETKTIYNVSCASRSFNKC